MTNANALQARRVDVQDSFEAIQDYCWQQGWTDGLPVAPPTEDSVRRMLSGYRGDPSQSLGVIQPRNARVTLEKVAINAVMAGCQPEYFPVVVAAVEAVLQEEFNVAGVSATTGGGTPVIIVSGPIANQLGINGDAARPITSTHIASRSASLVPIQGSAAGVSVPCRPLLNEAPSSTV